MVQKSVRVNQALTTILSTEKVEKVADECNIKAVFLESRFSKKGWVNDFEVEGDAGKVDGFMIRIHELEPK